MRCVQLVKPYVHIFTVEMSPEQIGILYHATLYLVTMYLVALYLVTLYLVTLHPTTLCLATPYLTIYPIPGYLVPGYLIPGYPVPGYPVTLHAALHTYPPGLFSRTDTCSFSSPLSSNPYSMVMFDGGRGKMLPLYVHCVQIEEG